LNDELPDACVAIDGYGIVRKDRMERSGGGLICYHDPSLIPTVLTEQEVNSMGTCDTEFLPILFRELSLLVIVCYHPFWNNTVQHESAIECLVDIMDFTTANEDYPSSLRILLVGDFNDLSKYSDRISCDTGLSPSVTFHTRGNKTIDQLFSNFNAQYLSPVKLSPIDSSDHCSILWRPIVSGSKSRKIQVRQFSKSAFAGFCQAVGEVDWADFTRSDIPLKCIVDDFQDFLKFLYDLFFRLKTIRVRDHEPAWMNHSLKILINECDQAFSSGNSAKFLRLRKKVIEQTCFLKGEFLKKAISSGNVKELWNALGTLSKRPKKSRACNFSVHELNEHFSSCVRNNDEPFHAEAESFNFEDLPPCALRISSDDVRNCLSKMRKVSAGPDGLPPWIFSLCKDILSPVIATIFNRSLSEGSVPDVLKCANITPVPKCGMPVRLNDYRPISILPGLSKIFERILCTKFIIPAIRDRVNSNQFAYVPGPGKGTTNALNSMYLSTLKFLDSQSGVVRVAAVDLTKAFDSVTHSSVLNACFNFNLPKNVIAWIKSYLSNRRQKVFLNGISSDYVSVNCGVPQGSVIGPILFSLVMDSLSPVHENTMFFKYADDLTVLHFMRCSSEDKLQDEIDGIVEWTTKHSLEINVTKTSIMNVITKKSVNCLPVYLSGNVLDPVSHLKILGCFFSEDLKWNVFVDQMVKRSSSRIYLILCLKRSNCPANLLFRAYCVYIRPILLYAFPVVCNMSEYLKKKLCRVERRVLRIINSEDFQEVTLFSAADRICENLFDRVQFESNHPLRSFFLPRARNSRNSCTLKRPKTNTQRFLKSFISYCP